jgi:hypothetical protein
MKHVVHWALALAAVLFLLLAQRTIFATLPLVGSVRFSETPFAGDHRLDIGAALVLLAIGACGAGRLRPAAALSGLAAGWLLSICFAAWLWRSEKLALLTQFGSASVAQLIQWRSGLYFLGAGVACAVAFLIAQCGCIDRRRAT